MAKVSIKANTKELRNGATQVNSDLKIIKSELTNLRNQVTMLNKCWSGDGHTEFERKFNNDCQEIQEFITEVQKYITDIKKVAENYEAGERAVVSLASTRSK